jgi:hypothetical protein
MADSKILKAIKGSIQDFASLQPGELIGRLRDPDAVKKMKKYGVKEAQIHRIILILQEHKPDSKEFQAYLKSSLV